MSTGVRHGHVRNPRVFLAMSKFGVRFKLDLLVLGDRYPSCLAKVSQRFLFLVKLVFLFSIVAIFAND